MPTSSLPYKPCVCLKLGTAEKPWAHCPHPDAPLCGDFSVPCLWFRSATEKTKGRTQRNTLACKRHLWKPSQWYSVHMYENSCARAREKHSWRTSPFLSFQQQELYNPAGLPLASVVLSAWDWEKLMFLCVPPTLTIWFPIFFMLLFQL